MSFVERDFCACVAKAKYFLMTSCLSTAESFAIFQRLLPLAMNCSQEFCTYASLSFTVRSLLDSDICGLHVGHPNLRRFFLTPLRFVSIRDSAVCQLTTNFDLEVMLPWQAFCPYASLSFAVRSLSIFVNLLIAFRSSESPRIFLDAPAAREHKASRGEPYTCSIQRSGQSTTLCLLPLCPCFNACSSSSAHYSVVSLHPLAEIFCHA
jgi:hypothetical protein